MDAAAMTRPEWMGCLARAPGPLLQAVWDATGLGPEFTWLRAPEFGAVMVRGRAGGTGAPFNLGEMTVTRCALRLSTGQVGHAYIPGRDRAKATIAALCDALLQDPGEAAEIRDSVLTPLAEAAAEAAETLAAKAAATKVDFFTLVRGEV